MMILHIFQISEFTQSLNKCRLRFIFNVVKRGTVYIVPEM